MTTDEFRKNSKNTMEKIRNFYLDPLSEVENDPAVESVEISEEITGNNFKHEW